MKIAFLSFYSGAIDRGVETATAALAAGLSKNHDVMIFQAGDRDTLQDIRSDPKNVSVVKLAVIPNWTTETSRSRLRLFYLDYYSLKIFIFTLKFLPYLFKEKYDVVIPTNSGWQVLLVRIVTWMLGKKMIVQGNAGIGRDDLVQLFLCPDQFIAISPQGYNWSKTFVPWVVKTYIPYGVDINKIVQTPSVLLPLKKPIVLCVAAFSPYKQIDLLIKAMTSVKSASLLVIGQGVLERELCILGEKLLGGRFLLKTGIIHKELLGYYKAARVFSLPSAESEAFGIVYVEAMAAGLPIVAPDDVNRREIVGDAGVLVDPQNTEAYSKAIKKALETDFGNKPKKQAEKFEWKKIVREYENLIEKLS